MKARLAIRRLSCDEIAVFKSIRMEALALEPESFASTYAQWADLSDDEWRRHLAEPVFVAIEDDVAIGMMALRLKSPAKMAHRAALTGVYVRAASRGAGVAGKLLDMVIRSAGEDGIHLIELGVRADNAAAIRFYGRHDFKVVGRIPEGFSDKRCAVDEILMVRRQNQPSGAT